MSFRLRVIDAYESGEGSYATVAERFVVGTATVKRWVAQRRRDGHVEPKPKAGGTPSPVRGATVDALIAALGVKRAVWTRTFTVLPSPAPQPGIRYASADPDLV